MGPATRIVLLLATMAVIGCGSKRPLALVPPPSSHTCLGLVDTFGRSLDVPIRWYRTEDDRERRTLNSWCATVGPGVLASARKSQAASGDIAVVSWNVHAGGGDLPHVIRELRSGRLTSGRPPGGFVLLLQEALRGGASVPTILSTDSPVPERVSSSAGNRSRNDVVTVAEAEGLSLFYLPSMRNGRHGGLNSEDRGNAILSTFDLEGPIGVELPFARQRRVAVAAVLNGATPGGESWQLRVASVHLDASTGPRQMWLFSSAHRERQAQAVVAALAQDDNEQQHPTIVGADLNTWAGGRREPAFITLQRWLPDVGPGAPFARWLSLDFLFLELPPRWNAKPQRSTSSFGSDHRPIVSIVERGA